MSTNATLDQAGHVLKLIGDKGVTKEQLTGIVNDGTLPDFLEAAASGFNKSRAELRAFLGLGQLIVFVNSLVVDYSKTLAEMIATCGFDWKSHDFSANRFLELGKKGEPIIIAELVHFNLSISLSEAEEELKTMGMRAGTIRESLAFGATYPEMQRRFPIVALGSPAIDLSDGSWGAACLDGDEDRRCVKLVWNRSKLRACCRFLAVRNNK